MSEASSVAKNGKPGAKPKLRDSASRRVLLDALRDGMSLADAAIMAGVSDQTLRNERQRDSGFDARVRKAEIECKRKCLKDTNKRKPEFLLERKWHEEFGRRNPEQLSLASVLTIVAPVFAELLSHVPEEHRSLVADRVELMVERLQLESKRK